MNFDSLKQTLPIMGKGMLAIFIVTAVLVLSIVLLNKLTNISFKKKKDDTDGE